MSVGGLFAGTHTMLVGVEDQDDGGLRLYLGHRSKGLYAVIYDHEAQQQVRRAWAGGQHVTVPVPPPDCIYEDVGHVTSLGALIFVGAWVVLILLFGLDKPSVPSVYARLRPSPSRRGAGLPPGSAPAGEPERRV